jgi:hypothetical protein
MPYERRWEFRMRDQPKLRRFIRSEKRGNVPRNNRVLNRARGGKRWTPEDDARLLALAAEGHVSIIIASILKRSFSSAQHRLRSLSPPSNENGNVTVSKAKAPGNAPKSYQREADLSCGAILPLVEN